MVGRVVSVCECKKSMEIVIVALEPEFFSGLQAQVTGAFWAIQIDS